MYKNYIFDLYGTLVDINTDEDDNTVWEKLSLFYGYYGALYFPAELKEAYYNFVKESESELEKGTPSYSYEGNPEIQIETVFKRLYTNKNVQPDDILVLHTGQFFRILTTKYIHLYDGVDKMLEKLHKKGSRVYLLSNAQKIFTAYELSMLGIKKYFDGILISSDCGVKKPNSHFFEILLEKYKLKPNESIMIGNDSSCDIAGAKKVGIDTYYIHSNISPECSGDVSATYVQMEMDIDRLCHQLKI